jgi:hypothetical protein
MKSERPKKPLTDLCRKNMVNTLEIMALAIIIVVALSLFIISLFYGARLSALRYDEMSFAVMTDESALVNLTAFAVMLLALYWISRMKITRRTNRIAGAVVLSLLTMFGLAWVLSVRGEPTCDAGVVYDILIALRIGAKDVSFLSEAGNMYRYYLVSYPFQFGYLSYMDVILAVIGKAHFIAALRGASVLLIVASYAGILFTTQELFSDERVTFLTILLLGVCIQPVLYASAGYSQIPSFAASVWGVYCVVHYIKSRCWKVLVPAVLFLAVAVYIKQNAWIVIAALCIVLLLDAVRNKTWRSLAAIVVMIVLAIPAPKLIQTYYEQQTGTTYGEGYPMISWIAMSMQEGDHTAGWYDHAYNLEMKQTCGEDMATLKEQSRLDIEEALDGFREDPESFRQLYLEKFSTQWLEPTFMSIWATNGSGDGSPKPKNAFAEWIYGDSFDQVFRGGMRFYLILLYGGFALCVLTMLKRRTEIQMVLPLIILGGILYHLTFEAQSRYTLSYLPLFVPLAAYGIIQTGRAVEKAGARVLKRGKMDSGTPPE